MINNVKELVLARFYQMKINDNDKKRKRRQMLKLHLKHTDVKSPFKTVCKYRARKMQQASEEEKTVTYAPVLIKNQNQK